MDIRKLTLSAFVTASLMLSSCAPQNETAPADTTAASAETTTAASAETTTAASAETTTAASAETTTAAPAETTTAAPAETTTATSAETTTAAPAETTTAAPAETTAATSAETTAAQSEVMKQYKNKLSELNTFMTQTAKEKKKPVIHIFTRDSKDVLSKDEYSETVIDVFNCDEKYRLTAEGGVKVRGNSSAKDGEKPYRIKFDKKQNMLGLHEGKAYKSWVLLKSNWNLIADFMAFSLAEEIMQGEYYSSDCTYVSVYINNEYKGLYLLCEQNQAADDRVDIYEPKKDEKQTDIGYFLEIDNYAGEDPTEPYFTLDYNKAEFTDQVGTTRTIVESSYTIKSDTTSEEQREFIHKYTKGVFDIVYNAVEHKRAYKFDKNYNVVSAAKITPEQAVEAVMDLDSVVNMLILEELVHNYDVGEGSFFMAVDFSPESIYKKLTFLAPWDYNWGYEGSADGYYYAGAFQKPTYDGIDRSNPWFTVLMKADWFRERVKAKWNELQKDNSLNDVVYAVCDELVTLESELPEDESWRINSGADIANFVDGRIAWLNEQWK